MKKLFLFCVCAISFSCGGEAVKVQYFERPIKTITVESLSEISRTFSGVVSSKEESDIGFKMGGEVTLMNIEEGEEIKKGALIASVDSHDFRVQFDAAKAAYKNSKSQISRYEKLYAKNAISQQDYEIAQTNYAHSKATYKNAEELLKNTSIYAPFSGIIEKKYVNQFQRVQPSEPVVRLINPKVLEIDFTLPVKSLSLLDHKNVSYRVTFDNYPNVSFTAKVFKVVNSSPDGSGIPVTLIIDDPKFNYHDYNVKSGFSCSIALNVKIENMQDDIILPISSIYFDKPNNRTVIWKYDDKTQTVNAQHIEIGELQGKNMVVIKDGVNAGDVVVSAGVHQITDGQKVKLIK